LLKWFLIQIQVFDEHFGFSVMLSRIPAGDVFFMQPSGKWKLLLTTSSMCYTNFKQSTTMINYERVCVCVCAYNIRRCHRRNARRLRRQHIFYIPKTTIIIVYLYLITCSKSILFLFLAHLSRFTARNQYRTMVCSRWYNERVYYRNRKSPRTIRAYC